MNKVTFCDTVKGADKYLVLGVALKSMAGLLRAGVESVSLDL